MNFDAWDKVEKLLDEFEEFTKTLDGEVQKKILKIIAKLDSEGGRLKPQDLTDTFNKIGELFSNEFKTKGYKVELSKIQQLVDYITDANVAIQKSAGLSLDASNLIKENNLNLFKEQTLSALSDAGLTENVILPMKAMINAHVSLGLGVESLITEFDNLFETGSTAQLTTIKGRSLQSYGRQIANDATNAINGQIQTHLKDKYDLKGLRYIGSTIKDSRPFCVHMIHHEKFPMTYERLDKVLKEYVGNKQKVVVGKNKNGTPKEVAKGAGMYPTTNTKNFLTVVGGYNCRHRAFAVRIVEPEK